MTRSLLPLLGPHGSRSRMTCTFRCGNACDHPEPNTSGNPHIGELLAATARRRSVLKAGAAAAGGMVLSGMGASPAAASPASPTAAPRTAAAGGVSDLGFEPVAPNLRDNVTVADGFQHQVVVGWGDPVERDAPAFDVHRQTPQAQAKQFGYNCDYVGVLPLESGRALLVVNHEYTDEVLMHPSGSNDADTIKRIAMAAHGLSVLEIQTGSADGSWRRTPVNRTRHNRRITVNSRMELTGPAAGTPRLRTSADPTGRVVLGTINNCAGGTTPWGTTLHGEENFNGYFDKSGDLDPRYAQSYARYGVTGPGAVGTPSTHGSTSPRSRTSRSASAGSSSSTRTTPPPRRRSARCSGG